MIDHLDGVIGEVNKRNFTSLAPGILEVCIIKTVRSFFRDDLLQVRCILNGVVGNVLISCFCNLFMEESYARKVIDAVTQLGFVDVQVVNGSLYAVIYVDQW